jgi:hypothetical protein
VPGGGPGADEHDDTGPAHRGQRLPGGAGAADQACTELRLLSLRFRIRNDLGLPEDSYDGLLDDA